MTSSLATPVRSPGRLSQRRKSSVMGYEQSLMFGQYRDQLASFARYQAAKAKELEELRKNAHKREALSDQHSATRSSGLLGCVRSGLRKINQSWGNWILLGCLGAIVALLSFIMDIVIHAFYDARQFLVYGITEGVVYQLILWVGFTVVMVLIAALLVRYISPQAAGSGVGEMKTILRGVVLKEYLSFRTLCAKTLALPFVLGSGLPLGKEGPFVHISSMIAKQLIRLFGIIGSPQEYDSRFLEIIAVACAVGVAATFAAPIGGILYSIEIVSVFFSVRSYWQGFFAGTVGALLWRLLTVWFQFEENVTHVFRTHFRYENPYEGLELLTFAFLGVLCGLSAFLFVFLQRNIVLFNRKHTAFHNVLQKYPMIYPILVSLIVGAVSFPAGLGQFYASWLSAEESMQQLFSNFTWSTIEHQVETDEVMDNWRTKHTSVFANTALFFVMNLIVVALTSTMPVPAGLIVPSFKIGAGLGRCFGETVAYLFPTGLNPWTDRSDLPIIAGAYAVAGSAGFAGAATGALSSAVIAFEMTGQITHLLPVIVTVLVANLVAQHLGPSIYDSLIRLKKLPYLPAIISSSSAAHRIFVEDFMVRDIVYVWENCTYRYLRHLLNQKKSLTLYPYVKSPETMILLGTIERFELLQVLESHLSQDRMMEEIQRNEKLAKIASADNELTTITITDGEAVVLQTDLDGPSSPASNSNSQTSPGCPVHGSRTRFQVMTIPENEAVEITSLTRHAWEEEQLDQIVDFNKVTIEPAPFQLVEGTSLQKTHSLFSMLGLQICYVTALGRLLGVVTLKELRKAIDQMNNGALPRKSISSPETVPMNR